jgi:hypothetical protein
MTVKADSKKVKVLVSDEEIDHTFIEIEEILVSIIKRILKTAKGIASNKDHMMDSLMCLLLFSDAVKAKIVEKDSNMIVVEFYGNDVDIGILEAFIEGRKQ